MKVMTIFITLAMLVMVSSCGSEDPSGSIPLQNSDSDLPTDTGGDGPKTYLCKDLRDVGCGGGSCAGCMFEYTNCSDNKRYKIRCNQATLTCSCQIYDIEVSTFAENGFCADFWTTPGLIKEKCGWDGF